MTEIIPFQSGPPPFGFRNAERGFNWVEEPKEQMAIGYIAQAHKDGISLRKIAAVVESNYGFKMTHAGVDKILKRRQANDVNPIMRSRPALPMPQFEKGIVREETLADSSEAYANVESLIKSLALELGNIQVGTLMLRIRHRCERLTDNIDHWDESVLKTIESSYQNAKAREAYLREKEQPAPQAAPAQFKPGDVIEFAYGGKWFKCGDWDYGKCHRYTLDPKSAGWHKSEHMDDEWECEECWQKDFFRSAHITFRPGKVELEMGDKTKSFTKGELTKRIKALEAEKKPTKTHKIMLSLFKEWLKGASQDFNRSHSCGTGFRLNYEDQKKIKAKEAELMQIQYDLFGFDPATLPPIPPTISL